MKSEHTHRREKPLVAKGIHAIEEALAAGKTIEKILLQRGVRNEGVSSVISMAQQREIPVQQVPQEKLKHFGAAHQGIVAVLSTITFYKAEDIVAQVYERGEMPLLILCDRITDVRNFGAIARTAYAAGAHALLIPQQETAAINAEAIKASAGALMRLPVCREKNMALTVKQLKLHGIHIVAAAAAASRYIFDADLKMPTAIILGSEGEGVSQALVRQADELLKLPMAAHFDSYNVSVAAGMILYEVMKQRMH